MSRPIPASLSALVMLAGLGLIYWALVGFGVLRSSSPDTGGVVSPSAPPASVPSGGGGSAKKP